MHHITPPHHHHHPIHTHTERSAVLNRQWLPEHRLRALQQSLNARTAYIFLICDMPVSKYIGLCSIDFIEFAICSWPTHMHVLILIQERHNTLPQRRNHSKSTLSVQREGIERRRPTAAVVSLVALVRCCACVCMYVACNMHAAVCWLFVYDQQSVDARPTKSHVFAIRRTCFLVPVLASRRRWRKSRARECIKNKTSINNGKIYSIDPM